MLLIRAHSFDGIKKFVGGDQQLPSVSRTHGCMPIALLTKSVPPKSASPLTSSEHTSSRKRKNEIKCAQNIRVRSSSEVKKKNMKKPLF